MSTIAMWTSKLGNKYPMVVMQQNDQAAQKELKSLRSLRGNTTCADCGRHDTSWSSVSHGVFICITCSDVHRSVGTHITKVKGCTGTYLWGPDELEKMRAIGNQRGAEIYGTKKVDPDASKDQKQVYVTEKYEKRSFAGNSSDPLAREEPSNAKVDLPKAGAQSARADLAAIHREIQPRQQFTREGARTAPVVKQVDIPDSLFDELFKVAEVSCADKSSVLVRPSHVPIEQATVPTRADDACSLDSFLNATLNVQVQQTPSTSFARPAQLPQFKKTQGPIAADPFLDWPF